MDISSILLNTQSPDAALRKQAEEQLNNALQSQMGQFMLTLTQALASEGFDVVGRQAAGLYLKNVLDAKDFKLQQQKIQAWDAVDEATREQIKAGALSTLQSGEQIARHTGAQLVAKLGVIDLPRKRWPTLLQDLLTNVTGSNEGAQHATLEALGYLCDGLEDDSLDQEDTNRVLTAIVDGVRADRPILIRLAAITALRHSLYFIRENFKRDQERNHIMQVVCEATQCSDIKVRVVAFECISTIASSYYEFLQPYMNTLYDLSFRAITSDQHEVGLQAIEFWSSIGDVEFEMIDELEFAKLENEPIEDQCRYYIKSVMVQLIPVLTETLKHQEEDQDEGTWNLSMAGATCLGLVAQTVRDDCVDLTMEFITKNIQSTEWRLKEAAIMAFGSILEGPSTAKVGPIVKQAIGLLMGCMNDPSTLVRDTTAWALGRICDFHAPCISGEMLPSLMQLLVEGLKQEPRVAANIAFAIHNLVRAFEESQDAVHMLEPYFSGLFDKLLETTCRPDANECNLRGAAYESLSILIQVGPPSVDGYILQRFPDILQQLEATFAEQHPSEQEEIANIQGLLCGTILVAIQRLMEKINPFADRIMNCLLIVLNSANATPDEEAFMAVGAVANAVNANFLRYMQHFGALLLKGLNNHDDYMVCTVAVGVVGDLCRALEGQMRPYCDDIVSSLLSNLTNEDMHRSVKPPMISCFGDIALAIEGDFDRYLGPVMTTLFGAAGACQAFDPEDEELCEYMNQLRESILEAFTGIFQGLATNGKSQLMVPHLQGISEFLACLAADDRTRTESVSSACVGLIGDIGSSLGKTSAAMLSQMYVQKLVNELMHSSTQNSKNIGQWAQKVVREVQN